MPNIKEAVEFLGLGMTEIKRDDGYYFITEKYKEVFAEKFRELFPQHITDEELREKIAEQLFDYRNELPSQFFYATWEAETKAQPYTKEKYLKLAEPFLTLLQQREEEAKEQGSSAAISEAYFRGRSDGLTILEANVREIFKKVGDEFLPPIRFQATRDKFKAYKEHFLQALTNKKEGE